MKLKFDHMIHYVDQLKGFKYPGELLKIHSGGKHHQYGTFNRLDVENVEKLKKEAKTEKGRVAFATKIVQDNFKQGFKTMAFRTEDIERVKQSLNERHIDTIGPINMDRENKKGEKIRWKLLYIADLDYMVRPPFFIEWNKNKVDHMQNLDSFFQKQFKIDKIIIDSSKRSKTLTKWQSWFNMDIIEENENYTDLKLEGDTIVYQIQDAAQSGYNTIVFKDNETMTPYSIIIKGAKYRFEPNEGTN